MIAKGSIDFSNLVIALALLCLGIAVGYGMGRIHKDNDHER